MKIFLLKQGQVECVNDQRAMMNTLGVDQFQNCLDPAFEKIQPYSKKEMKEILQAVQKYFPKAKLRGS